MIPRNADDLRYKWLVLEELWNLLTCCFSLRSVWSRRRCLCRFVEPARAHDPPADQRRFIIALLGSDHRESRRSTVAPSVCSIARSLLYGSQTSRTPKIPKHKKAPRPKRIAGLFGVTDCYLLQRRTRYWHLSRRDGW